MRQLFLRQCEGCILGEDPAAGPIVKLERPVQVGYKVRAEERVQVSNQAPTQVSTSSVSSSGTQAQASPREPTRSLLERCLTKGEPSELDQALVHLAVKCSQSSLLRRRGHTPHAVHQSAESSTGDGVTARQPGGLPIGQWHPRACRLRRCGRWCARLKRHRCREPLPGNRNQSRDGVGHWPRTPGRGAGPQPGQQGSLSK